MTGGCAEQGCDCGCLMAIVAGIVSAGALVLLPLVVAVVLIVVVVLAIRRRPPS